LLTLALIPRKSVKPTDFRGKFLEVVNKNPTLESIKVVSEEFFNKKYFIEVDVKVCLIDLRLKSVVFVLVK